MMSVCLSELETFAAMVGFHYASVSIEVGSGRVTLQCEDRDGQTLTADGADIDGAMVAMMAKLGALIEGQGN
jgi:hypothetical protein